MQKQRGGKAAHGRMMGGAWHNLLHSFQPYEAPHACPQGHASTGCGQMLSRTCGQAARAGPECAEAQLIMRPVAMILTR